MFEPLTQTVAQLATRWNCSANDVLTHAMQRNWPVYFQFDGLVFDVGDRGNRAGGNSRQVEAASQLKTEIDGAEIALMRNAMRAEGRLQMTEWEDELTDEQMSTLRQATNTKIQMLKILSRAIEKWYEDRRRFQRNGALRAAPLTLQCVAEHGVAHFPIKAFHPESPTQIVRAPDGQGHVYEGRIVALEGGNAVKENLTADDLFVSMVDVRAIEAKDGAMPQSVPQVTVLEQRNLSPAPVTGPEAHIPGKLPNINIGKVAISVAWAIECERNERPAATQVMARMRELANNGQLFADVLRSTPEGVKGVNWGTVRGKALNYSEQALGTALTRWWATRQ